MKILGSDYDGTLTVGGFDEKKLNAIEKWQEAGNKIGVVSGRGASFLDAVKTVYGFSLDFLVAYNGAYVIDSQKNVIFKKTCNLPNLTALINDLFFYGAEYVAINSEKVYMVKQDEKDLKENEFTLSFLPPITDFYQLSVKFNGFDNALKAISPIDKKYGSLVKPLQNGEMIDVIPLGINKATGLLKVMEMYGAKHSDVIAVGDNFNDIDMIKEFTSYAMENGVDEIKRIATYQTKSVTDLIEKELFDNK